MAILSIIGNLIGANSQPAYIEGSGGVGVDNLLLEGAVDNLLLEHGTQSVLILEA